MKRKTTMLVVFIVIISTVFIFTACENGSSKLVGRWILQNAEDISTPFDELEFFSDSTYSSDDSNYNGKYSVDGNRIKFDGILVEPITCSFSLSGKTLTLTYEDETWEFNKVN